MKFKKVSHQIVQIFSANIVKAGLGFLGSVVVLKGWSLPDIGDIYTLIGVLLLLSQLGDLGTGASFVKLMGGRKREKQSLIDAFLGLKHVVALGLVLVSAIFFALYFSLEPRRELYGLGVVTLFAASHIYGSFFSILLQSRQNYFALSIIKVVPVFIKVSLLIIFLYWPTRRFILILLAFMAVPFFTALLGWALTGFNIFRFKMSALFSKHGRVLLSLSKWVFAIGFLQTWFSQLDIFMLKRMSSDYQIAQFVGAQKLATAMLMLSQAVFTVMLPKMRNFRTDSELMALNKKILLGYFVMLVLITPGVFLAPYLVPMIFGGRYPDSIPILKVFLYQVIGYMFINNQSLLFFRKNKLPLYASLCAIQLALNFIGNYMVIYQYKALGAVMVSTVLNNLFFLIMSGYFFYTLRKEKETL